MTNIIQFKTPVNTTRQLICPECDAGENTKWSVFMTEFQVLECFAATDLMCECGFTCPVGLILPTDDD